MEEEKNIKISSFTFVILSVFTFFAISILYFSLNQKMILIAETNSVDYDSEIYTKNKNNLDPFLTENYSLYGGIVSPVISDNDPSWGDETASIEIVQFSDFVCKYCSEQQKIIKEVIDKYPGKIRYIWKDYPEIDENSLSFKSALAGRCFFEQGLFWKFYDNINEFKGSFVEDDLLKIFNKKELNQSKFRECIRNPLVLDSINNNVLEANALGINGVPFIYINNRGYMGGLSKDELISLVEIELKNNND